MKNLTFEARCTILSVAEEKVTKNNRKFTTVFCVADMGYYKDNNWVEKNTKVNITFFGTKSESAQKRLLKGRQCVLDGIITINSFTTSKGDSVNAIQLIGTHMTPFGSKPEADDSSDKPSEVLSDKSLDNSVDPSFDGFDDDIPF